MCSQAARMFKIRCHLCMMLSRRMISILQLPQVFLRRCHSLLTAFVSCIAVLHNVDVAYCYRPCSMLCHSSEPCRNGCTNPDAVWVEDSGGPKEPCISHAKEQFLVVRTRPGMPDDTAGSCAKMAEQIEMLFGFWTQVGRIKQL